MRDPLEKPVYMTPENLKVWIPALYRAGKQYRFYKSREWLDLRHRVLEANHYECEDCRGKSPAKITRAVTVHHDRETKFYPELALSTFWIDKHGRKHQNLFALCEDCHNARHERFGHEAKPEPLTPERW